MLVSYNWLKEYFKKLPKPQKLADILNFRSYEVEGVENVGDDTIINIDVLPNRAHDSLCHHGIAREISTITGAKFFEKTFSGGVPKKVGGMSIEVQEEARDFCRRYIAREIQNIEVKESPIELRRKLEAIGQRSINNIVDITNIVMFEIGQPMHAFDTHKISGATIIVRRAKNGEVVQTLDNCDVKLSDSDPVIADANGILAIAGVKGGKRAEVTADTTDIVLESANFNPTVVRRSAKRVGISTESSKRFENEITPDLALRAIAMATELILKYASTAQTCVCESKEYYPRPVRPYKTGSSLAEINNLLGTKLSERKVAKILRALNFEFEIVDCREKIVEEARSLLGRPYKHGAIVRFDAPKIFDCSSFVAYIYSLSGFSIPRMSVDQYFAGSKIEISDLQPGDLVFSNTGEDDIHYESNEFMPGQKISDGIDHVGIFLGNDEIIHSSRYNKSGIEICKLSTSPSFKNITGCVSYVADSDAVRGGEKNDNVNAKDNKKKRRRFTVTIPVERLDVTTTVELVEEIGRVYGFNKIPNCPVDRHEKISVFKPAINPVQAVNNLIRKTLVEQGFSEIITYSFVAEGELAPEKPIAEDKAFLRPLLVFGMSDALKRNAKNIDLLGLDQILLFEIGKVFTATDEFSHLCLGVSGKEGDKKAVANADKIISDSIKILSDVLGVNLEDGVQLSEAKKQTDGNIVEIDLSKIYKKIKPATEYVSLPPLPPSAVTNYKPISQYPFVLRDIAVWLPTSTKPERLLNMIRRESGDLLVNTKLFDVYQKDGRTSYAFRLVFQSSQKTLTDYEVNEIMKKVEDGIASNGWEVR